MEARAIPEGEPNEKTEKIDEATAQSDGEEGEDSIDEKDPHDADPAPAERKQQNAKVDRGVFVMCNTSKEQRATGEAQALLSHYADLWEEAKSGGPKKESKSGSDILDELRKEVAGLRGPQRRFEARYTHVKGILLFIYRGPWAIEGPDPVEFVIWMIGRMKEANEYGRFIARIIPLQVCGAAHQLMRNAQPLITAKFPKSDPSSFEIDFACRNNNAFNRREVQVQLIGMGLGYPHFVSHQVPQKTILVEIANKTAGISVVPRYYTLARFNIQQQQYTKAKVQADADKIKKMAAQDTVQTAPAPASAVAAKTPAAVAPMEFPSAAAAPSVVATAQMEEKEAPAPVQHTS